MSNEAPNNTMSNDYPPGHPAGTDEFISAGAVISGRGMGTGGALGTRARVTSEATHPVDTPTAVPVSTGPTVLIAVDGTSISEHVVRTVHRLFGEDATYLAINVGKEPYTQLDWAYVWPVGGASTWGLHAWPAGAITGSIETATAHAAAEAEAVAHDAGLTQATPLGDVGDPTTAIIDAAHHHHADVVAIGADSRGWLSHLIDGSVERKLLREADFAILVVAAADPDTRA